VPGLIFFSIGSLSNKYLQMLVQKNTIAITDQLFLSTENDINIHPTNSNTDNGYYVIADINLIKLTQNILSDIQNIFDNYKKTVEILDMNTGVFYSLVLQTLWAITINKKLDDTNAGEAFVVIQEMTQNPITERLAAKVVTFVTEIIAPSTVPPKFLFTTSFNNMQVNEISYNTNKNPLNYIHSGVCNRLSGSGYYDIEYGPCIDHFSGILLSTYDTTGIWKHIPLSNEEENNVKTQNTLRDKFYIENNANEPTFDTACPSNTFSSTKVYADGLFRECNTCPFHHYSDGVRCVSCDTHETKQSCTEISSNRNYAVFCSFASNEICRTCPTTTACPIHRVQNPEVFCGNGIYDFFAGERCDKVLHRTCCGSDCRLLINWSLEIVDGVLKCTSKG
jgi:hypothetical protein